MLERERWALAKSYRSLVHPALRSTVRRRIRPVKSPQRHTISVIVPFYNVEPYFAECLTSIVEQTYRNLEIVIVDDGSTDGSLAIARSYARWDRRIRIIRQRNAGLGAARNTGIRAATGTYLTFVDSDDTLPRDALSTLLRSIRSTHSDFVVGALTRLVGQKTELPPWVRQVHAQDRLGVRLAQAPDVLPNVFAWNKLFLREFFDRVVGGFPEGIRYEDQEPTARAYVHGTFDVLRTPVYNWRQRDDHTSLTQQKSDPADLADRLVVKQRVLDVMAEGADPDIFEAWLAKAIGFDLRPYFEQVPRTDLQFWNQLRSGMLGLAEHISDDIWRRVAMVDRYPALAVLEDHRDDVITFVTRRDEYGWSFPGVVDDGRAYVSADHLRRIGHVPRRELLELAPQDVRLVVRLDRWTWQGRRVHLRGCAYLTNLPTGDDHLEIRAVDRRGCAVSLPVERFADPGIDREARDAWNSHAAGGFTAVLDVDRLDPNRIWGLEVVIDCQGLERRARVHETDLRGAATVVPIADTDEQGRWIWSFDRARRLKLRHGPPQVVADLVEATDFGVVLAIDDPKVTALTARSRKLRRRVSAVVEQGPESGRHFRIALPSLGTSVGSRDFSWRLNVLRKGKSRRVALRGGDVYQIAPPQGRVRFDLRSDGTARLIQSSWSAIADHVELGEHTLLVRGSLSVLGPGTRVEAYLANELFTHQAAKLSLDLATHTFTAIFELAGDALPTKRRGYSLRVVVDAGGPKQRRWVRVGPAMLEKLPLEQATPVSAVTLSRTTAAGALWVRFRHPLTPDERGSLAQRRLHEAFQQGAAGPVRDLALFESFGGKSVTDSARALFEEVKRRDLGLELFWTMDDLARPVPEGATPLLLHSRQYLEVLFSARYLVNNSNFPHFFRKQPGQTYVQTWHGTPLKRIGHDVPGASLSLPYRSLMRREPTYWDYLLAQNAFAAGVLPQALGYDGEVIAEGYPRNDLLSSPNSQQRRTRVRAALGLTEGQLAVLYAPTWRDSVATARGYSLVQYLDFRQLRSAFGQRCKVLLRGHANTSHDAGDSHETNMVNVTHFPEINDLFLAADVLITDYSSVMFDYCVTGKPMLFLAPDLAQYRDRTRGFYFDFEATAPGPICGTTREIVAHLERLGQVQQQFADRYAAFRRTYAPHDDGHAAERVANRIWGPA